MQTVSSFTIDQIVSKKKQPEQDKQQSYQEMFINNSLRSFLLTNDETVTAKKTHYPHRVMLALPPMLISLISTNDAASTLFIQMYYCRCDVLRFGID